MKFDNLLSRADEETLQSMLGRASVRLITLLDPNSASPSRLRELLLSLRTREGILASKKNRPLLLDLMRPKEAELLAQTLGIKKSGDVYESLKGVKLRGGSENERTLYRFFELQVPEE